jgi:hypothetical protein
MYWAVCFTLCSALQLYAEKLPYQAVMQPVRMFSIGQLYNFDDLRAHAKYFQSPKGEEALTSSRLCWGVWTMIGP